MVFTWQLPKIPGVSGYKENLCLVGKISISFWNSSSTYLLTSSRAWKADFFSCMHRNSKGERFLNQQELPLFLENNNQRASHTLLWWREELSWFLCQSSVPFHPKQHRLWLLGSPVQGQELHSVILVGPSQLLWFCGSVNCFVSLCSVPVNLFLLYPLKKKKKYTGTYNFLIKEEHSTSLVHGRKYIEWLFKWRFLCQEPATTYSQWKRDLSSENSLQSSSRNSNTHFVPGSS